ncbi:MAG: hypothetical protein ABSC05_35435 [Candidatus Solibacter sp.]|jgi:hypothetical protein
MPTWTRALLCVPVCAFGLLAADNRCEPSANAQEALDQLSEKSRDMKYAERLAYQRKALEELLRKFPGEMAIERRYVDLFKNDIPDELPALQKRYRERAAANAKDPAAAYIAGVTLQRYETPEAIRLMESAKKLDPGFGWAYLSLTNTYSRGKFADKAKSAENIAGYFGVCPDSTSSWALSLIGQHGTLELQAATAKRLRERLAGESDARKLERFSDVWAMEFRTRPVPEHAALRKQVAADLKVLEARNPKPDADWLDFLKGGYKQSGAAAETMDALDDRVLKEFPSSDTALSILGARWRKAHAEPKAEDSAETWDQNLRAQIAATEGWIRQFPKEDYLKDSLYYLLASLRPVPFEKATAAGEATLTDRWGPDYSAMTQLAGFYLDNGVKLERALELIRAAEPIMRKAVRQESVYDDLTEKQLEDQRKYQARVEQGMQNLLLTAYRALHRVEDARALKAKLEGPVPQDAAQATVHWTNLALEAETEGRKTDALTYYQAALNARLKPPDKRYGRTEDPLMDDARKLFMATGGTETAWAVWSQRSAAKSLTGTDARWERADKPLPAFELADLTGKTWTLKALEGKTVLINVWASW